MAQELLRAVQENKMSELSQHLDKKSKQKMDTIEKTEQLYLKTSVWTLAKNRIIWLLILMISATVTGAIIQGFEDVLQSVVILASFIPMLMDTGGNSGSQSSTLIIRGLALGEITTKDIFKVIFKEFKVSIVVASILSSVNFLYFILASSLSPKFARVERLSNDKVKLSLLPEDDLLSLVITTSSAIEVNDVRFQVPFLSVKSTPTCDVS